MRTKYSKRVRLILLMSLGGLSINAHSETHLVQKDDTLWRISDTYLGSGFHWKRIWQANDFIENPDLILPGQVLQIPRAISNSDVAKSKSASRNVNLVKPAVTRPLDYRNDSQAKKIIIERNGAFVIVDADSLKPKPADAQKLGKGIFIDQSLFK